MPVHVQPQIIAQLCDVCGDTSLLIAFDEAYGLVRGQHGDQQSHDQKRQGQQHRQA